MDILLATKNQGKITELKKLLTGLPFNLRGLNEFPDIQDVEETGTTFAENAELKAVAYAKESGLFALADDSGLEVFALNGAPGVHSARYAGENATNEAKMEKLLRELNDSGQNDRRARFVCVISFADPIGKILHQTTGECRGIIAEMPSGAKGFGYDPIFIPHSFDRSFGELPEAIKQMISHRARAIEQIIEYLSKFSLT
jgi:XTP/dITP diphosphohydrolase